MKKSILLFAVIIIQSTICSSQDFRQFKYVTNEFPPIAFMENGVLKGAGIEILREIWKNAGVAEQPIILYPFARTLETVEIEKNAVAFAVARNETREKLYKWVGPISSVAICLFGKTTDKFQFKSFDDVKNLRIGVINKDVAESIIVGKKYPEHYIERAPDLENLVAMLRAGRIDLICVNKVTFTTRISQIKEDPAFFKNLLVLQESKTYFILNKLVSDDIISSFQKALDKIEAKRVEIVSRFNLLP